ncbi:hypothetical protein KC727_02635 [Candidatus Kaiserbacteria bacterium]|nr:hypothetical protein [Candidatus Kaiserbacteria bacterium]
MSKRNKANPQFTYTPTQTLPTLRKIETEWDLKKYFYTSEKDPNIEKDVVSDERAYAAFAKKYRGRDFTSSAYILMHALKDYEKLLARGRMTRALYYLHYRTTLNAKDTIAEKKLNLLEDRANKATNQVLFFELTLGKIPKARQKQYRKEKILAPYHYLLTKVFKEGGHHLTDAEERVINLLSASSSGMWSLMVEKIISNRHIMFEGKKLALPEAFETIDVHTPAKKTVLWNKILDELEQISEVSENELTALVSRKKTLDELRNYAKPYSATVLRYENEERGVEALVDAISAQGFALSKKFYKLKAKYHAVLQLPYEHKYNTIGENPKVSFEDAVEICRDAFYGTKREYGEYFDTMLTEGNIDVYPKSGKRGGAFMSYTPGTPEQPIFVFLNHTDNFSSLQTLAHEMGHGLHSARSKKQKPLYESCTITTAETASTLFENIVFTTFFKQAPIEQRASLLHDKITRDIATIQRQIAFFNFELEMHQTIRSHGAISKEELNVLMAKHLRSYLGPGVNVTERDGLSHVYVHHFRSMFYVYTYTYGILMSNIMQQRLAADPKYIKEIDNFLSAGGSDTVENIFQTIGINARKVETFLESLEAHAADIRTFEKMISKK